MNALTLWLLITLINVNLLIKRSKRMFHWSLFNDITLVKFQLRQHQQKYNQLAKQRLKRRWMLRWPNHLGRSLYFLGNRLIRCPKSLWLKNNLNFKRIHLWKFHRVGSRCKMNQINLSSIVNRKSRIMESPWKMRHLWNKANQKIIIKVNCHSTGDQNQQN